MTLLLIGRGGQVGWELERALAPLGAVAAIDFPELDLDDVDAIRRLVRETRPQTIVNAAAYTAVDKAEAEPERAMRINGVAPGVLAEEAKRLGALLVHYSTDYVFDGGARRPYSEADAPRPLNAYGRSKLAGDEAIAASGARHLILRTSWVYGLRGRNFLLAILERVRRGETLRVVDDQIGAPTWCRQIAEVTTRVLASREEGGQGLYNLTAAGETSWCGFARAIVQLAGGSVEVQPITTADFPTAAARPHYSVLDNTRLRTDFGIQPLPWRDALARCMAEAG